MNFNTLTQHLKEDYAHLPTYKVAVLADSSSQLLCQALKGYGYTKGIHLDIWNADHDQVYQTILDKNSTLYTVPYDYVIIYQSSLKFLSSFYKNDTQQKKQFAENQLEFLRSITTEITENTESNIIILNYTEINDGVFGNYANKVDNSFIYQLRKLNYELMNFAMNKSNINICDLSSIQNTYGSNSTNNNTLYVTADIHLNIEMLPVLAKNLTDIILTYQGYNKKCLILDLDNILWGGVIGDDGIDKIEIGNIGIGKVFSDFQRWVVQLKDRGIIIAVCSKNTESVAKQVFESHPDMILQLNDIAIFKADWNNKADNIRHIQSILNVSFDSIVFLDDDPAERALIKKELPLITTPDLPEDPADYLSYLYQQNVFETSSFTVTDTERNTLYKNLNDLLSVGQSFTNESDFLESLQMQAEVKSLDTFLLPRAAQLTQRSNQFNVRTIRYTEQQMEAILQDNNKYILTISLNDTFVSHGLISLVVLEKKDEETLFIDSWIMSCRVFKRGVEYFMLNEIISFAKTNGFKTVIGEYLPTQKNHTIKDIFADFGFTKKAENYWQTEVDNYIYNNTFIKKTMYG